MKADRNQHDNHKGTEERIATIRLQSRPAHLPSAALHSLDQNARLTYISNHVAMRRPCHVGQKTIQAAMNSKRARVDMVAILFNEIIATILMEVMLRVDCKLAFNILSHILHVGSSFPLAADAGQDAKHTANTTNKAHTCRKPHNTLTQNTQIQRTKTNISQHNLHADSCTHEQAPRTHITRHTRHTQNTQPTNNTHHTSNPSKPAKG